MDNQDHKASQWQTWNSFFAILKDVAPFFQKVEPKLHLVLGRDLEGVMWICWGPGQKGRSRGFFGNAGSKWKESQDGTSPQGWVDMSCPKGTWSSQWPEGVLGPQTAFPLAHLYHPQTLHWGSLKRKTNLKKKKNNFLWAWNWREARVFISKSQVYSWGKPREKHHSGSLGIGPGSQSPLVIARVYLAPQAPTHYAWPWTHVGDHNEVSMEISKLPLRVGGQKWL